MTDEAKKRRGMGDQFVIELSQLDDDELEKVNAYINAPDDEREQRKSEADEFLTQTRFFAHPEVLAGKMLALIWAKGVLKAGFKNRKKKRTTEPKTVFVLPPRRTVEQAPIPVRLTVWK